MARFCPDLNIIPPVSSLISDFIRSVPVKKFIPFLHFLKLYTDGAFFADLLDTLLSQLGQPDPPFLEIEYHLVVLLFRASSERESFRHDRSASSFHRASKVVCLCMYWVVFKEVLLLDLVSSMIHCFFHFSVVPVSGRGSGTVFPTLRRCSVSFGAFMPTRGAWKFL